MRRAFVALLPRAVALCRELKAFHKTGAFLTRDVAALSCDVFGNASDLCAVGGCTAGRICLDSPRKCSLDGPATRRVTFLRAPLEQVVSSYLYHKSGAEIWTRRPGMGMLGRFPDELKARGLPKPRKTESYAAFLDRAGSDGLYASMVHDAGLFDTMKAAHRECVSRPTTCAVACLGAFGNATAWRAVLAFWEVPATPRARLLAALASYYDDVAKRRTAGDPHFTSRRGRDALRARAAAIDAEQFSGWFAGSGWCRGGVT